MNDATETCSPSEFDIPAVPKAPPVRLPWRPAAAWALLALVLGTLYAVATFPNLSPQNDIWDYAQQARQISRGEGFTSLYTYPTLLRPDESPPYPVRWRMPFYSLRGARFVQSGTPPPVGYMILSIGSQTILVLLVFLLAAHVHSNRAAHLAAAAAVACPLLLDPYHPGLSQLPVATFGLLIWILLLRRQGIPSAIAAGAVAALIWYTRAESLLFVPLWAWVAWRGSGGGTPCGGRAVVFVSVFALLCAPWPFLLHQWNGVAAPIQGNPMLLYTPEYPGYASSRTYGEAMPGMIGYLLGHPWVFLGRWVKDVVGFGVDVAWGLGPGVLGLAIAGLLLRGHAVRYRELAPIRVFFVAIALQVAAFAALERSPRFLTPVIPLACIAAGIAAAPALGRICGRRMLLVLFVLLVGERAAMLTFETRTAARRFPPLPAALADTLRDRAPAWPVRGIIATDVPDWTAWHLDRPAVLLPTSRTMASLERDHPIAAILLSPQARRRNAADGDSAWIGIWDRHESIGGFDGPTPMPGGARLYVRAP